MSDIAALILRCKGTLGMESIVFALEQQQSRIDELEAEADRYKISIGQSVQRMVREWSAESKGIEATRNLLVEHAVEIKRLNAVLDRLASPVSMATNEHPHEIRCRIEYARNRGEQDDD